MKKMSKETWSALSAQRRAFQSSVSEAVRDVSERVWDEAVAACQGRAIPPENPYTMEAIERRKKEAEKVIMEHLERGRDEQV